MRQSRTVGQWTTMRSVAGLCFAVGVTLAGRPILFAAEGDSATGDAGIVVGQPSGIMLEPKQFRLLGPRSEQHLLVTGKYGSVEVRDLTPAAQFTSSNPKVG